MKSSRKKNLAVCVQRLMDTRGLSQRDAQTVYDEVMKRRDHLDSVPDEVEIT